MKSALFFIFLSLCCANAFAQYSKLKPSDSIPSSKPLLKASSLIAPDLYTRQFGFFCRKELQLEKITKTPVRLRLGSLNYCDYLEGKQPINYRDR